MAANQQSEIRRRVVVIGAGQAGLSAAYHLQRDGLVPGEDFEILDANPTAGGAWSHRWDALTFDDVHGLYPLPGSTIGPPDPAEPAREVVKRYYAQYEDDHNFRVSRPWRVTSVDRDGEQFVVTASSPADARRVYRADAVISGSGTWDRPYVPHYPGRFGGPQLTTRDFADPEDFRGKRVLVVGGGTSAVQFLLLLNEHGASTVWSTRRAPQWTDREFDAEWGIAVERGVAERTRRGLRPLSVVAATGLPLIPRYADGIARGVLVSRGAIGRLTETGVDFADGTHKDVDVILWATGFRASIDHLAPLRIREPGGGVLMARDDVSVVKMPGLFLVGYGRSASTLGATRAGRAAARAVRRHLAARAVLTA